MSATILESLINGLPPIAYDPRAPLLGAELASTASVLETVLKSADQLLVEQDPAATVIGLPDWERNYRLPDACAGTQSSIERRHKDLVQRVVAQGDLSEPYMLSIADRMGYPGASITRFGLATCTGPCDQQVNGPDWKWVWRLNVSYVVAIEVATCVSPCNVRLRRWGNEALECAINRAKPAHTLALFSYLT
jgi:uncharacterized protein YmfQ (DUF2313 family)